MSDTSKNSKSYRKIEFKLYLTNAQEAVIDTWLDESVWVWNVALEAVLEFQQFKAWERIEKEATKQGISLEGVERCRLQFNKRNVLAVSSPAFDRDGNPKPKIPIVEPRLKGTNPKSLSWLTMDRLNKIREQRSLPPLTIPAKFMSGILKRMGDAWGQYIDLKKRDRHILRFKNTKKGDKITSLYCWQPEAISLDAEGDRIGCPGLKKLGRLKTKDIGKRGINQNVNLEHPVELCIIKSASGWFCQITAESFAVPFAASDKAVGLDPGVRSAIALDNGREYKSRMPYKQKQKSLRRLQRKAARQIKGSKNWKKTQLKVAKLHDKVKRSRRSFNHALSTKVVKEYGLIAFEDTRIQNMVRAPKPKLREDGKGYAQNGAKRKAGLTRSLTDVAIGQLRQFIEAKSNFHGRLFVRPDAKNSSRKCHVCGTLGDRKDKKFKCLNEACSAYGQVQDADVNAARNHLLNSSLLSMTSRNPAWAGGLPVERVNLSLSGGDVPLGEVSRTNGSRELMRQEARSQAHGGEESPITSETIQSSAEPKARKRQKPDKSVGKSCPKTTFAKTSDEKPTQLDFWDVLLQGTG